MNTKELIDRIFKEPGVKFELTEFENLGKPIHEIIAIYPKATSTGKDVFQSIVGQFQTQQHARGSAQAELYPSDIDRFVVPLLDADKQRAIGDLVRESLVKQQQSRQRLEQAKTRVEQLIEEAVQP